MTPAQNILISNIRVDGGTQPRATIDFDAVFEYMDAMTDGAKFPPVVVYYDGTDYWLADGFHRVNAADKAGCEEIACELHQGTQQDAQWYSFAANKTNGLRRTNDDKQRAVKAALKHPLGAGLSDQAIAKHVGVSPPTVASWREKITPSVKTLGIDEPTTRTATRNGSRYQMDVTNIGKTARLPDPEAAVEAVPPTEPTAAMDPTYREAFRLPAWQCTFCGEHCVGDETTCTNCYIDRSDIPESSWGAREWFQRVQRAVVEISDCSFTAEYLAAAIRRSNSSTQLRTQLEKTHAFIAAVLAEAVID